MGEFPPVRDADRVHSVEQHERLGHTVREILGEIRFEGAEIDVLDIEYDGMSFRKKGLIPPGWKIVRRDRDVMYADYEAKEIKYGDHYIDINTYGVPEGQVLPMIPRKGFFLTLLHEIGHAQFFESLSDDHKTTVKYATKELVHKDPGAFTEKERGLYQKYIVKNERSSWEWALQVLRTFRKEGIDLEPELKDIRRVLKAIRGALKTYKLGLGEKEWLNAMDEVDALHK